MRSLIKKAVRKAILWAISEDLLDFAAEVDQIISNKTEPLKTAIETLDYVSCLVVDTLKDKGIELKKEDNLNIH